MEAEATDNDNDGGDLPLPITPTPKRPPGRPPKIIEDKGSQVGQAISQQDEKTVYQWLKDIGAGGSIQVKLFRTSPMMTAQGELCKGYLQTYDDVIDEQEIARAFGGGTFQIKVFTQSPKGGGWQYATARTFSIGSVPAKLPGSPLSDRNNNDRDDIPAPVVREDISATKQAMGVMEKIARDAQDRADRERDRQQNNNGPGLEQMAFLLKPLELQINNLNSQINQLQNVITVKDKQILDLSTRKPETSFQEQLLFKSMEGESARVMHLREEHASELRQLRQSHTDEMRAAREQNTRDQDSREKAHTRELQSLRDLMTMSQDNLKSGHEARTDALKMRVADLESAINVARTELIKLRDQKEKGPVQQMEELATMKAALDALTGGGGGEDQPMWERILGGLMESPLVKAAAHRIEQAPPAQPPPQPVVVRRRRVVAAPVQEAPAQPMAQPGEEAPPPVPVVKKKPAAPTFTQMDAALAIQFMESAVNGKQPPEAFAASVRSMLPGDIVQYIKDVGIDEFMKLAKVPEGSPLLTQHGKNYIRKVAKILVEGS